VQALLFDPNKLAPTYPASMIRRPPKFNACYDVMGVKPLNGATWRLEVSGLVADKQAWKLSDLQALPQTSMVSKHICVEGWSYSVAGAECLFASSSRGRCGSAGQIRRV
jgi:hypothetical protein